MYEPDSEEVALVVEKVDDGDKHLHREVEERGRRAGHDGSAGV